MAISTAPLPTQEANPGGFFGHPRGLVTLFSTELWERFSFAGMRALLFLYMTTKLTDGGMGFSVATAGSVLGTYGALLFVGGILGGWLSDRFIGPRRAVLYGGLTIMLGHVCLSRPGGSAFAGGLCLLLLGTSLFKPSMLTLVGELYTPADRRRDAGFSIFYMGINIGSFLAPLVCGFLAQSEKWKSALRGLGLRPESSWHWGFGAAAVGMALGLIQYVAGGRHLGQAGRIVHSLDSPAAQRRQRQLLQAGSAGVGALLLTIVVLHFRGIIHVDLVQVSKWLGRLVLLIPLVYIPLLFLRGNPTPIEQRRISVVVILFFFMILFWAAEGQAGSSLTLFAQRYTRNSVFGYEFPSVWWMSVSSVFIISLSPLISWIWLRLGRHEPSSATKFVLGLLFAGCGFLIIAAASTVSGGSGQRVSPLWLLGLYLLHTLGELCLSPIGLSMVTKLAPAQRSSQLMGLWFLAVSVGNVVGGWFAGMFDSLPLPKLFGAVVVTLWMAALLLALLGKTIRRLMAGV